MMVQYRLNGAVTKPSFLAAVITAWYGSEVPAVLASEWLNPAWKLAGFLGSSTAIVSRTPSIATTNRTFWIRK